MANALRCEDRSVVNGWAWQYSAASIFRQCVRKEADGSVLKDNIAINWTGPFKTLAGMVKKNWPNNPVIGSSLWNAHI